jgi:hypothetical protein
MTFEIKNKFLEKFFNKYGDNENSDCIHEGLGFRYGPSLSTSHTFCYSAFDREGSHKDGLPFWFHPCNGGNKWNESITSREAYAFNAITHPDSPWQPWLDAMPEQFEGYDTPESRAALIARVGLIFGETAWDKLNKPAVGCFAVFHRVAYEHNGVRNSLEAFLQDERTKVLPLRWNVFAAHHIRSSGKKGNKPEEAWSNWHNSFNPLSLPTSAICYVKARYNPALRPSFNSEAGRVTFMGGNSDRLFIDPAIKGPPSFPAEDLDRYGNDFKEKAEFENAITINLWHWENKVAMYV